MDSFKEVIEKPKKIVLTMHRKPDGDSVGSNLALYKVLTDSGHTVTIYSKDQVSESFSFLPYVDKITYNSPSEIQWQEFDMYIALDMSSAQMIGEEVSFPENLDILVIDHHATNTGWGKQNILDSENISTASMLYELFVENDIPISKEVAKCLLTGLLTDSGFFEYIRTAKPLQIAGELMKIEADYQEIIFNIRYQQHIEDLQFLSKALERISIQNGAVILPVPYDVWNNFGITPEKNYLLTGYIRSIKGTKWGVLIIEETPGNFRLEFRSREPDFDVSAIAKKVWRRRTSCGRRGTS